MTDLRRPLPNYDIKQPVTGPALPPRMPDDLNITDEEYQALIEQAVQLSIAEGQVSGVQRHDVDAKVPETFYEPCAVDIIGEKPVFLAVDQ